jgi:polysaccharide export outer membrane protein
MLARTTRFIAFATLAILLGGCAQMPIANRVPAGTALPPPDPSVTYRQASEYRLGAQDLLEISVFRVPDLSRTVRVNSNGEISHPLIGSVHAGGLSIGELEAALAARYADGYIKDPQVTVFVKEFASQRVTVEGAIEKPGVYPLTGATTLLQTIAMSGDLAPLADLDGVVLFRYIDGVKMAAVYDMRALRAGQIEDPPIYGGDLVVVEQSNSKTALRYFIESIPALGLFVALDRSSN